MAGESNVSAALTECLGSGRSVIGRTAFLNYVGGCYAAGNGGERVKRNSMSLSCSPISHRFTSRRECSFTVLIKLIFHLFHILRDLPCFFIGQGTLFGDARQRNFGGLDKCQDFGTNGLHKRPPLRRRV